MPNGLFINALGLNTGEVFGVFAAFQASECVDLAALPGLPPVIDYSENSANFRKLQSLEEMIVGLQAPKWPFALDNTLVAKGRRCQFNLQELPRSNRFQGGARRVGDACDCRRHGLPDVRQCTEDVATRSVEGFGGA